MAAAGRILLSTHVVSAFALDGGAMFGVVPRPLWERAHPADERGRIRMVARVLVARFPASGRVVVVDAGLGAAWSPKEADRYGVEPAAGLAGALAELGLEPADVTDALITHLHFDHSAGFVARPEPGAPLAPVLPRAVHHVQRAHLEWAREPSPRDRASFLAHHLAPLDERGLLCPVDGPATLLDGLEVLVSDGHTPAMQLPVLTGAGGTVAFPSDLIPTASHLHEAWGMAYDLRPLALIEEKRRLLARAAAEGWTLVFEHDPRVEAGRVADENGAARLSETACPAEL